MATNKQKRALRGRQKILNREVREPTKVQQIRELQKQLDTLPVNAITGQPMWPEEKDE